MDRYLEAAVTRKRQIALLWPTAPKSLVLVHALATLERWTEGDKMGIRGLTFPVKTNVFYPLNHMRFARAPLLRLGLQFAETSPNPKVKRSCRAKDPYLSAFNSALKDLADPRWSNPTLGDHRLLIEDGQGAWREELQHQLSRCGSPCGVAGRQPVEQLRNREVEVR